MKESPRYTETFVPAAVIRKPTTKNHTAIVVCLVTHRFWGRNHGPSAVSWASKGKCQVMRRVKSYSTNAAEDTAMPRKVSENDEDHAVNPIPKPRDARQPDWGSMTRNPTSKYRSRQDTDKDEYPKEKNRPKKPDFFPSFCKELLKKHQRNSLDLREDRVYLVRSRWSRALYPPPDFVYQTCCDVHWSTILSDHAFLAASDKPFIRIFQESMLGCTYRRRR